MAMTRSEGANHLSGITTCWTLVDAAKLARSELMQQLRGCSLSLPAWGFERPRCRR